MAINGSLLAPWMAAYVGCSAGGSLGGGVLVAESAIAIENARDGLLQSVRPFVKLESLRI